MADSKKDERFGMTNINKYGSELKIIRYGNARDIDVLITTKDSKEYIFKNRSFSDFKKGDITSPYDRKLYGVGYLGIGKFNVTDDNGEITKEYRTWNDMIRRGYSKKLKNRNKTYKDVFVCEEWHDFQNFAKWFNENYYEIENERVDLDKDILVKGNKIYSPETCCFVPSKINTLFTFRQNENEFPGVSIKDNGYQVTVGCKNKSKYLGFFKTKEEAFEVYKKRKEEIIKQIADEYKDKIPSHLYQTLYEYKI